MYYHYLSHLKTKVSYVTSSFITHNTKAKSLANKMQSRAAPEKSSPSSGKATSFSDDASASDATDNFIKTLTRIQSKGVHPDLIGSIITHYASKWLPDLAGDAAQPHIPAAAAEGEKRKCFIETLVRTLPQEKAAVPCGFLLRLLRVATHAAGVEAGCLEEIEKRVSWQLEQLSLSDIIIPGRATLLLDFELVARLVKRFIVNEEEVERSGAALTKVAKLVDCYLAEAAVDSELKLQQFFGLASALPGHARSSDDGIYRAIDIYLKAHPSLSKQDRKRLCMLIDSRKLSTEASLHAAQNERLPVRAVIQVLLSEQDKLNRHIDWSGSLVLGQPSPGIGPDATARCLSKRETVRQHMEIRRLKEDILMLQSQCMSMEMQIEKLMMEKKKNKGNFSWKKLFKGTKIGGVEGESVHMNTTPLQVVGGIRSSNKWRKSMQIEGV